jgi:hypothetical protein
MSEILLAIVPIPRREPGNFCTPMRNFLDRPRSARQAKLAARVTTSGDFFVYGGLTSQTEGLFSRERFLL